MPNYSDDLTSGQVLRASIAFLALNMCVAVIALFAMWLSSFIKGQLQDLALFANVIFVLVSVGVNYHTALNEVIKAWIRGPRPQPK